MYDFAPNSLQFCTKFITISHQILYDLAPNSLRFRTKFIKMSQHTFTLTSYDFAPKLLRFRTKSRVYLGQN